MMRVGWATVAMLLGLAAGCGDPATPALDVTGTWWAVSLDGEPIEIDRNTAALPWFEIGDSAIGGNLGCNDGGGSYRLEGNRLIASDLVSEAALCTIPDGSEVMVPTERILTELLTSDAGFDVTVAGDTMTWTGANHTITFAAASGEVPPPTTAPPQDFDRLDCSPGVVVESRHPADGISPEELATQIEPATVRVEQSQPLQWWGYDEEGSVTVGVFGGDGPDTDFQVVTCSG